MNCPFKNLFSCKEENNENSIDDQYVKQMCKAVDRAYNKGFNYTYVRINEDQHSLLKITAKFNDLNYKHALSGIVTYSPLDVFIEWPKPNSIIKESQNMEKAVTEMVNILKSLVDKVIANPNETCIKTENGYMCVDKCLDQTYLNTPFIVPMSTFVKKVLEEYNKLNYQNSRAFFDLHASNIQIVWNNPKSEEYHPTAKEANKIAEKPLKELLETIKKRTLATIKQAAEQGHTNDIIYLDITYPDEIKSLLGTFLKSLGYRISYAEHYIHVSWSKVK